MTTKPTGGTREWPIDKKGWLVIEDQCEDGSWSGYASSMGPGGNLAWEDAIEIQVVTPGTVAISKETWEKVVETLGWYGDAKTYEKFTLISDPRLPRVTEAEVDKGRRSREALAAIKKEQEG